MEKDTIRDEEDAQKAYEDFVKDTNASIEAKSESIVNKSDEKAAVTAQRTCQISQLDHHDITICIRVDCMHNHDHDHDNHQHPYHCPQYCS